MTSGQMWNHIRAPPFMDNDPRSGSAVSDISYHINVLCQYEHKYDCAGFDKQ